ncbi:hypothetical protein [Actinokineospora cianjurensis]|uniref:Uncharacterized protein n=1 Tax=Actinokineospora cianjurensis TaxID=585224 RepID=A0A421B1P2_9PSEU|nr:hypothetical protein [Actinokineospora cianjurensis]RLK58248.1 hypothetical protein CLV68_4344 [Actinokineospora cianjurensis]
MSETQAHDAALAWGRGHRSPTPVDFALWHVRATRGDDGLVVEFDATPASNRHLGSGTEDVVRAFCHALDVRVDEVVDWSVPRFCSTYYSDYSTSDSGDSAEDLGGDWADRHPVGWHVRITVVGTGIEGYRGVGPFGARGVDETWQPSGAYWVPGHERCELIADVVGAEPDVTALAAAAAEVFDAPAVASAELGPALHHVVVSLGDHDVATAVDRLDHLRAAALELGWSPSARRTDRLFVEHPRSST